MTCSLEKNAGARPTVPTAPPPFRSSAARAGLRRTSCHAEQWAWERGKDASHHAVPAAVCAGHWKFGEMMGLQTTAVLDRAVADTGDCRRGTGRRGDLTGSYLQPVYD